MDEFLTAQVRERARNRCEYCRLADWQHPGVYEVEHVIAKKHGGPTVFGNLAYASLHCNRHKGSDLAGIDRQTSRTKLVRLFNPRRHNWAHHFYWDGPLLVGRTPIGRVTVQVLDMNDELRVALREELMAEGTHF